MAVPRSDSVLTKRYEIEDSCNIGTEYLHRRIFDIRFPTRLSTVDRGVGSFSRCRWDGLRSFFDPSARMVRIAQRLLCLRSIHGRCNRIRQNDSYRESVSCFPLGIRRRVSTPMTYVGTYAHGCTRTQDPDGCRFTTSGYRNRANRFWRGEGSDRGENPSDKTLFDFRRVASLTKS